MKWLSALLVCAAVAAYLCQERLDASLPPPSARLDETLPSARALGFLSLSYRSLAADYYWLRALSHFGDARMHKESYPNLIALTERVLALDPFFAAAYYFAGTALTVKGLDPSASIALLEQGMRHRPDDWRIPFLLGFNRYYFANDYVGGAEALAAAAKLPGAPPQAGPLAARLMAEAGTPEVGLRLIDSILVGIKDDKLREEYLGRRRLLELEIDLKWLNHAAERFRVEQGGPAKSLDDLVARGLLTRIPDEPLGGRYFVDAEGTVRSTHDALRLRLHSTPEETQP